MSFTGNPTATLDANGWTHVFAANLLGVVQQKIAIPGVGWYGWNATTTWTQTAPAATSATGGTIQLFTLTGSTNNLRQWNYTPTR